MIEIRQIRLPIGDGERELKKKAAKLLRIPEEGITSLKIQRKSLDARKKPQLYDVYTVRVQVADEGKISKKVYSNNIMSTKETVYRLPAPGTIPLHQTPVIVGSGPAGLFCGLLLARAGYRPLILERGRDVDSRCRDVGQFWKDGMLLPNSNVQFGEGGAGAFSDGKLNTLVKDVKGRSRFVLETFISFGAPAQIGYEAKPHIGTDILRDVVKHMRQEIINLGGKVLFETCVTGLEWEKGKLSGVTCQQGEKRISIPAQVLVLAIGHSARDTFFMLQEQGFVMEQKAFAVGLRVEHPQSMINENQYGSVDAKAGLPAASYKLTASLQNGRGVYSFCMCPGGYVVNAASEPGGLAVNGMSYSRRDGANANSAVIVTVTPRDFGGSDPLAGVAFQRRLERNAFAFGDGKIPQQLLEDFSKGRVSTSYGAFESCAKGQKSFGPLHQLFSREIAESFVEGMHRFGRTIPGFDRRDCILSGVESRTSSPVRIVRKADYESSKAGVYPCGEGAGYAGGILSAAMDGMKVAEAIIQTYSICRENLDR